MFAFVACIGTMHAYCGDPVKINGIMYCLDDESREAAVSRGVYYRWHIDVPPSVNYDGTTYRVTRIGEYAFYGCDSLFSITMPNTIIEIEANSFTRCSGLSSISIPNGVEKIGDAAFRHCSGLTTFVIPDSVTEIGNSAFQECTGLASVTIPNSVTKLGVATFAGCTSLRSVVMPNSVTEVEDALFAECTGLTSIVIGKSVQYVGSSAFAGCISLRSIEIPDGVFGLGKNAFDGCTKLNSITIPHSVTTIECSTFIRCTGLPVIEGIRYADTYLIEAADTTLSSYTIGDRTRWIGCSAFDKCVNLTSITCRAIYPPECHDSFGNVDKSIPVYVPLGSLARYEAAEEWKDFLSILPINATFENEVPDAVILIVTDSTADITWPQVSGADTYELVVKDANGNIICTLVFDAQGRLLPTAFTRSRGNVMEQTQVAGFSFTLTGLNEGTTYNYTITAKNDQGQALDTQQGSFTTKSSVTGIADIINSKQPKSSKFFHNGRLYILRDAKIYTAAGQQVR